MPITVTIVTSTNLQEAIRGIRMAAQDLNDLQSIKEKVKIPINKHVGQLRNASPSRTGAMKAAWRLQEQHNAGQLQFLIVNDAPHSIYVIKGTGTYAGRGMIRPQSSNFFVFQGDSFFPGFFRLREHRGQRPNSYLDQIIRNTPQFFFDETFKAYIGAIDETFAVRAQGRILRGGTQFTVQNP